MCTSQLDQPSSTMSPYDSVSKCRSKDSLRRIRSVGAIGEGSSWDLRVRPAPPPASGNLGTLKSGNVGICESGNLEI